MRRPKTRCIGILTSGGDCPGLNAAIRGVAKAAIGRYGIQVIGMLLGSLFVVEYIFNYPGVGLLMINAVFQRDFPIIQAIAMLSSAVLVCVNILVDLAATNIDRRLQY